MQYYQHFIWCNIPNWPKPHDFIDFGSVVSTMPVDEYLEQTKELDIKQGWDGNKFPIREWKSYRSRSISEEEYLKELL